MKQENKMKEAEYIQRYSDVGALRSFLYLQFLSTFLQSSRRKDYF